MRRALFLLLFAALPLRAHPPVSVVLDSHGNAYYSDLEQVWRIAPTGARTLAVPNVHTHELYIDAQDNLYGEHLWYEGEATNKYGYYIWKRTPAGRISMVRPRTEGFRTNYGFNRDAAGNMYWLNRDKGEIVRIAPNGARSRVIGELKEMHWLIVTPAGTIYVTDGSDLVRVRNGQAVRLARDVQKTNLTRPWVSHEHSVMGIWTDRAENVYLADYAHAEVKRVTPAGRVTTFLKSSQPWAPIGGTFAPNGDLWLMEATFKNDVRVRKIVFR